VERVGSDARKKRASNTGHISRNVLVGFRSGTNSTPVSASLPSATLLLTGVGVEKVPEIGG
jgi:hypothetical protein